MSRERADVATYSNDDPAEFTINISMLDIYVISTGNPSDGTAFAVLVASSTLGLLPADRLLGHLPSTNLSGQYLVENSSHSQSSPSGDAKLTATLKCSADPRGTLERLQGKQGVIAALIEGRVDLFEATAKFRTLSEDTTCNSEQLCRSVIGWVHLALCDRPERAEAVTGALEQELDLYLSRHAAGRRTAFN